MIGSEWNQLPVIDWELANQLAGNRIDLARDMLAMLAKGLPNDIAIINHFFSEENYADLHRRIHKLHGAVAYCGAPRLKAVLAHIERQLKSNIIDNLPFLINRLNTEIQDLLKECEA